MTVPIVQNMASSMRVLVRNVQTTPMDYGYFLPLQYRFLRCPDRRKLIRAGNQWGGKTHVALIEVIHHCMGDHPEYPVRSPPITAVIVTASWSQSISLQEKLWHLLPKNELHASVVYIDGHGFRGKNPCVKFKNGSKILIKTTNQGGLNLAGSTVHVVLFDEPPKNPRVYSEMVKRTVRTNGYVMLAMTPVNAPVAYLQDLCEKGQITDIHSRLTPEALIPVGDTRPIRIGGRVCDQTWIDDQIRDTLPHEVEVTVHGGWEFRTDGAMFGAYRDTGDESHVTATIPEPFKGKFRLHFGADHGSGTNFSDCAVLVATLKSKGGDWLVWVVDEYVSDGQTTGKQDALGIVAMLARWGWTWKDIDHAYGDRVHKGPKGGLGKKSNGQLQRAIAREMGVQPHTMGKEIQTVKRGQGRLTGSVGIGCRLIHQTQVRNHFWVSERCTKVRESMNIWDGSDDKHKHIIDALRYALDNVIFERRKTRKVAIVNG